MMLYPWKNRALFFSIYLVLILMLTKVNCQLWDYDEDVDKNSKRDMDIATKSKFNTTTEDSSVYNRNLTAIDIVTKGLEGATINSSVDLNSDEMNSIIYSPWPQSTITPANLANSDDLLSVTSATLPLPANPIIITSMIPESTTLSDSSTLTMESAITSDTTASPSEGTTHSAIASATTATITQETTFTSVAVSSTDNPVNDQEAIFDLLPISTLNDTPIIDTTLSPDSVSITKMYEGERLTVLCSSEILTINEDFSMPQILPSLKKEYAISFEIPGDQENVELEIEVTNSNLVTKEFKIFDNKSKLNKMYTFIKIFENNTVASWTNRTMRCGSGPSFTQQTWEYINSNRKKIEIKVSSPDHALNIVEPLSATNTLQPESSSTQMSLLKSLITTTPSVSELTDYSTTDSLQIIDKIIPKCPEDLPYEKFYDPNEEPDFEHYDYNEMQNEIDEKFKDTPYENCPITEIKWIMSTPKEGLTAETNEEITEESDSTTLTSSTEMISVSDSNTETSLYDNTTRRQNTDSLNETAANSTGNIPDIHQLHLNISVELDHIVTGYYKNGSKKNEIDIISRDYKDFILNETTGQFEFDSHDNKIKIGFIKDTDNFIKIAFDIPQEILSEIRDKVIDNPQHSLFGKDFFGDTHLPEEEAASTTSANEVIPTSMTTLIQLPSTTIHNNEEINTEETNTVAPELYMKTQLPVKTIENPIYIPKYDNSLEKFNYNLKNKNPKLLRLVQKVPTVYKEPIRNNKYEIPIMIPTTPSPTTPSINKFQVMFPSNTLNSKLDHQPRTTQWDMDPDHRNQQMQYSNLPHQQPKTTQWDIDPDYRNQQMQYSNLPLFQPPLNFVKRDLYKIPNYYNNKVNQHRSVY